jgi:putative endonuclease
MYNRNYFVYIITNPGKTVFYTGFTNNIFIRMNQHYSQKGKWKTFAGRYYCYKLLYYEVYNKPSVGIEREKEIKNLSRDEKIKLIKTINPSLKFIKVSPD